MNKKAKIFAAAQSHGNVVLNFGRRGKREFDLYAEAFHKNGQVLAGRLAEANGYSDLDACPILFLYRQALELYLKAIIITGNDILALSNSKPIIESKALGSHRLLRLLPALEQVFKEVGWEWGCAIEGISTQDELSAFVRELEQIDPDSFAFRYPTNKEGASILPHHFVFNVPDVTRRLDAVLEVLAGAALGLKVERDSRAEAACEAQH